ncbi:MAG: glycoside hydrolase family 2 TIM barrel-domain containing protein [Bryobacteraceae bacterium]
MRTAPIFLFTALAFAAGDIPRDELPPNPQFVREGFTLLNGQWDFEFDDANTGLRDNWAEDASRKFSRKILVPFCFESKKSGIAETGFHPWVWYRRTFQATPGKRMLLHFGAVDYRAWVWINGRLAGTHEGGNTPFRLDVTHLAKPGANTITLRAEDPPTDRFIPRGKQFWEPKSRGIFYTRTSGIWQSVWLETAGESYLDKVRVTTTADGVVRFEAKIARTAENLQFTVAILDGARTIATTSATVINGAAHAETRIPNPRLWLHTSPNLYDVRYELRSGTAALDQVKSYFGIREVAVNNGRFTINGRPIFLKWLLDQGYWPESLLTPPSAAALEFDIKTAKEMGFNGVRKHQKVEDPVFLYLADKMGFLVSDEMANAYEFDADYAARFTREWLDVVERDYSHPSIVMWVPINESWGVPNLRDPQQQSHLKSLYWLTKALDPTRPVIDNDGWEHVDTMDLFTIHDYAATGARLYEKYKDIGKPGARVPDNGRSIFAPGYTYGGQPFLLSEFGGIAYIPEGNRVPGDAWGYAGVEKTADAALHRLRGLYEAIAKIPAIAGICYTQITDVEQEVNGLMTYDRKLKFDSKILREINSLIP